MSGDLSVLWSKIQRFRQQLFDNATSSGITRHTAGTWRQRNIIWYNLPYSRNVETNVGKCFLSLVDQHFPKCNSLHKIFNRNTITLSNSCMNNVKSIISSHNKSVIRKSTNSDKDKKNCNCRKLAFQDLHLWPLEFGKKVPYCLKILAFFFFYSTV